MQIWQIADTENRGFLTPPGFSVALRLIAHCQAGKTPTAELASSREQTYLSRVYISADEPSRCFT
jgi:hypothetical protein